jgi:hypothetical protein
MADFDQTTLWRLSNFERYRTNTGVSAFGRLSDQTLLPSTLLAELGRLEFEGSSGDVLEVVAACMRNHESALLCLQIDGLVVPVTLYPNEQLYHSPRDLLEDRGASLARATVLSTEPPGLRPPGHFQHERIGTLAHYRPLNPLLWAMAQNVPRSGLLSEIAGAAAYRATRRLHDDGLHPAGALDSAAEALTRETVSIRTISGWPGMSVERARRLLNGLYLLSALRLTRGGPAARAEPKPWFGLRGGKAR